MKRIVFALVAFFIFLVFFSNGKKVERIVLKKEFQETPITDTPTKQAIDTITVIGVGDLMLGTTFPTTGFLPPNDGKDIFANVHEFLSKGTVTFGNLEGILMSETGVVKKFEDPLWNYAFKTPNHYAGRFKEAGFDLLSVANNHVGDFGPGGRASTAKVLDSVGLAFAGFSSHPYTIIERDGTTFGFCAFSTNSGVQHLNNYANARSIVKHLDSLCQVVIVSFHGGGEGLNFQHITRSKEIFLTENRGNPYEFARMVIDAGADVVFGHGPHVTRAVDLYKGKFIAYSLGNFATYARFNIKGLMGIAPIIKVFVDAEGNFLKAEVTSTKQVGRGIPVVDETNRAFNELIRLTETDFPESDLEFAQDGIIRKRTNQ